MQIKPDRIKKILIVRNDRFGEFLLNIPAIRAVKETFKGANVTVAVDDYIKDLCELIPYVDRIIEYGSSGHTPLDHFKMLWQLEREKFDIAIMLNPSKVFNILSFLAGIPIRVGYDRKLSILLTDKIPDKKFLEEKHEVEYNLELVSLIGAKTSDKSLSLKMQDDIIINQFQRLGLNDKEPLIVLHPYSSDQRKVWPTERFEKLAEKLAEFSQFRVVIIGKPQQPAKDKIYLGISNNRILDLSGKTNLKELAGILKKSRLLISVDSGPVHLAACFGTPVLALFRNDLPGKTSRRWGPWGQGHKTIEKNSLISISVDEVFQRAKEMLKI